MSLDLIKNALYQAIKAGVTGLTVYPEPLPFVPEVYPNLTFVEVGTENLGIKTGLEWLTIETGAELPAAPLLTVRVIARKRSRLRLQLRDSLGDGPPDAAAYQAIRDRHNALDRFFTKLEVIAVGAVPRQTLAEVRYIGDRQSFDPDRGIFLSEFEVDFDPWRLLDTGPGIATYRADAIEVGVTREADDRVLVTRIFPLAAS